MIRKTKHQTVAALAYRSGTKLQDQKTGESFDYRRKSVAHVELILPEGAPQWAKDLRSQIAQNSQQGVQSLVNLMEAAEKRKDAQVWREFEFALLRELSDDQNLKLAQEFAEDYIAKRGIPVVIHAHFDVDLKTGERKPHIHATMSTRTFEEEGLNPKKEIAWNNRNFIQDLRVELCNLTNFHLKLHGHKTRVDHRSYAERGIDLLPQPKMRKGVFEMEKRAGFEHLLDSPEAFFHRFKTRMGQDWQDKKIQNMFKVMTQPETVIQNVASSQSTFVWRDIKQEVAKRVPDAQMASYVCDKIQTSSALVNVGEHSFFEGTKDSKSVPIFTSRETLEKECNLGHLGERLAQRARHPVNQEAFKEYVKQADQELKKEHGTGLSDDQKEALSHICSDSDLSCLVGYAGSGKTTVLGVAQQIWKDSGYRVHGLAPTGRAADNLVDSGITSSQTLHKFLKQFDRGSCHYNANSVLVIDEGGMVPVHLMKQFLHTVNHLGVKTVIVGDGNQLQPIEAGAAFRSVLRTTNPVSLETVVRQKEKWQRQASQNFGAGRAHEALSAYAEKGHLHLKSSLPSLVDIEADLASKKPEIKDQAEVDLYRLKDTAKILKGVAFGQMLDDVEHFTGKRDWRGVFNHQDFETRYTEGWKALETKCCEVLSHNGFDAKAPVFRILRKHGLETQERLHDLRAGARAEILKTFRQDFKSRQGEDSPDEKTLMFSYSRKDVQALNVGARAFLQKASVVERQQFTHQVTRPYSDSFGRQREEVLERSFAKGDLIVFLQNDNSMEIRNGHRGRITHVDANKIQVEVFGKTTRTVSFATNLYNAIDYGWATTIHKTQGSTLDKTLYLASPSDSQNLAYVAMTRHREDVQVFGSKEEFENIVNAS